MLLRSRPFGLGMGLARLSVTGSARSIMTGCAVLGAVLASRVALADDAPPKPTGAVDAPIEKGTEKVKADTSKRKAGWTPGLSIGGSFNLLDSRNVVGQQDGTALSLGAAIDAELAFNSGKHEWRSTLEAAA